MLYLAGMNPRFIGLITVRTSSSRLPQKALLKIKGRTTIEHLIDRSKLIRGINSLVLCTSTEREDAKLQNIALKNEIKCFRGSLTDKLERWNGAVKKYNADYFVTIDGDDLFADPHLIDLAITQMRMDPCDFINIPKDLVCGGAEFCISAKALDTVCKMKNTVETEMMWVYFTRTRRFKVKDLIVKDSIYHNKKIRMTLDYPEDLAFFKAIFNELGIRKNTTPLIDILLLIEKKPELATINYFRQEQFLKNQRKKTRISLKEPFFSP